MALNLILLAVGFLLCGHEFGFKTVYTSILLPVLLGIFEFLLPGNGSLTGDALLDVACYIFTVSIGLGILEKNRAKLALELPPEIPLTRGGAKVNLLMELPDPFAMTKSDLSPLLEEMDRRGLVPQEDLIGRIFISYTKNGAVVHGVAVGFIEEK